MDPARTLQPGTGHRGGSVPSRRLARPRVGGAAFGQPKIQGKSLLVRGLNALTATISIPLGAPVIPATRLRYENANSVRGAAPPIGVGDIDKDNRCERGGAGVESQAEGNEGEDVEHRAEQAEDEGTDGSQVPGGWPSGLPGVGAARSTGRLGWRRR
jgi:hypothetical protein